MSSPVTSMLACWRCQAPRRVNNSEGRCLFCAAGRQPPRLADAQDELDAAEYDASMNQTSRLLRRWMLDKRR